MSPRRAKRERPPAPELSAPVLERRAWLAPVLLGLLTLALWSRTLFLPLHYWDDSTYIFEDPRLEALSWSNLSAILTRPFFANYHPITTLTYALDRALWGRWNPGYHITHLLFYTAGVILVYYLFKRLLKNAWAALLGAALYSAHTLHVEVIAWLACRKDVVCLVFYSAALLLYARYAERREARAEQGGPWPWRPYLGMAICTLLALGAKGYAVILPGAYVAYDLCFAGRFRWSQVLDKLPVLALALALTVVTVWSQDETSALIRDFEAKYQVGAWGRTVILLKVFALYVGRSLLPIRLCSEYMLMSEGWMPWWVAVSGLALLTGMAAGFLAFRRRLPALALGLALFALPLTTTMNTFFTLRTWMTDRYMFFPTLGTCLVLAAVGLWLRASAPGRAGWRLPAAAGLSLVVLYGGLTLARIGVWTSTVLLWSDVLRKNYAPLAGEGPLTAEELRRKALGKSLSATVTSPMTSLAGAWKREGHPEQARKLYALVKSTGQGGLDLAAADLAAGRYDEAIQQALVEVKSGGWFAAGAAKIIGDAYANKGEPDKAREWYGKAYELFRKNRMSARDALLGQGALEFKTGNFARALEIYKDLSAAAPGDPRGPFYEGLALESLGRAGEAYERYRAALAMPQEELDEAELTAAEMHRQMGLCAVKLGRKAEAIGHFEECLRLNPTDPQRPGIEQTLRELRREKPAR